MFGWFKNRRRRRILAGPVPAEWLDVLQDNVWQYAGLSEAEQAKLCDLTRLCVAEKNFEGCGGQELDDAIRVTVAAYACLLILKLDPESYDHVISVLIYPDDYFAPQTTVTKEGFQREEVSGRLGEAWSGGTVVLSWSDVRHRRKGANVVIHEFAHQLDMLNRSVDGTPPLRDGGRVATWRRVMAEEYEELCRELERGRRTFLDPYGSTNIAEFFAVATESFFEDAAELQRAHAELYSMFRDYYGQDPATWLEERRL